MFKKININKNKNFSPISSDKLNLIYHIPVIYYPDAKEQKQRLFKDNKTKSGVYCWTNKMNGKKYIGSSINLRRRIYDYYSLKKLIKSNVIISRALLKYSFENFQLEILEYCEPDLCTKREQYYFNLMNPTYNILKIAYSLKGFKHS
jgi:hypothetical protein